MGKHFATGNDIKPGMLRGEVMITLYETNNKGNVAYVSQDGTQLYIRHGHEAVLVDLTAMGLRMVDDPEAA